MNRRTFLSGAAAVPALLQSQTDDGFTPLFDGKSLAGWRIVDGPETAFYVRDGAIVVHEGSGFPAWLRSDHQYENFDFRGSFTSRVGAIRASICMRPSTAGRYGAACRFTFFRTTNSHPGRNRWARYSR